MEIMTGRIDKKIKNGIIENILCEKYKSAAGCIPDLIDELHANIPDDKRISYGIVHTIKVLSEAVYTKLAQLKVPAYKNASALFRASTDRKSIVVSLGVLSFCGLDDYKKVLPYFESCAAFPDWEIREESQMFFRKLIKKYPDEIRMYLLRLTKSKDPNLRRFVSETLRPVRENRWFYKSPDYPLSILRNMFKENTAYPRTSVGNNLSDLARQLPELAYGLVGELVASGDKNSYWIAYRACRNLVKKEPERVMRLLKVDEYKYKEMVHKRNDD